MDKELNGINFKFYDRINRMDGIELNESKKSLLILPKLMKFNRSQLSDVSVLICLRRGI